MKTVDRLRNEVARLRQSNESLQAEIGFLRRQLGAGEKPTDGMINWDSQPLGKMPDAKLGSMLGVSNTAVRKARHKRGIPSYNKSTQGHQKMIDYDSPEIASILGVLPDKAVARQLGVDPQTVRYARRVRHIQAPSQQTPRTKKGRAKKEESK